MNEFLFCVWGFDPSIFFTGIFICFMIFRILLLAEITYNLISNVKCNHKGGFEVNI